MITSVIRESDDRIAKVRISLGRPPDTDDFYLVFRGDPKDVILLLEDALRETKDLLLDGLYEDRRSL